MGLANSNIIYFQGGILQKFYRMINIIACLPVVDELSHEFEDRGGASWVMVPQFNGSLQNGHVGGISAGPG